MRAPVLDRKDKFWRLESENTTKDEPAACRVRKVDEPRNSVAHLGIAKAIEGAEVARILYKWIDAQEIGMVENIDATRPELERRPVFHRIIAPKAFGAV